MYFGVYITLDQASFVSVGVRPNIARRNTFPNYNDSFTPVPKITSLWHLPNIKWMSNVKYKNLFYIGLFCQQLWPLIHCVAFAEYQMNVEREIQKPILHWSVLSAAMVFKCVTLNVASGRQIITVDIGYVSSHVFSAI